MKVIYSKNFSNSRDKIILDYCKGKKVLHIGACDAPFTENKYNGKGKLLYKEIDNVCLDQLGIDLDIESIEFLNSKKNQFKNSTIKYADMNKLENLEYQPDVIIFGEVIEHLMNLEIALTNIKKVMNENTILIISTPNAFCINYFINILFRNTEYVHEDHKVIFSTATLSNLLTYNKYDVEKIFYTLLDEDVSKLSNIGKIERKIKLFIMKKINGFSSTLLYIVKKGK